MNITDQDLRNALEHCTDPWGEFTSPIAREIVRTLVAELQRWRELASTGGKNGVSLEMLEKRAQVGESCGCDAVVPTEALRSLISEVVACRSRRVDPSAGSPAAYADGSTQPGGDPSGELYIPAIGETVRVIELCPDHHPCGDVKVGSEFVVAIVFTPFDGQQSTKGFVCVHPPGGQGGAWCRVAPVTTDKPSGDDGNALIDAATDREWKSAVKRSGEKSERITELEQRLARVAGLAHDRDGDTLEARSKRLSVVAEETVGS